MIQTHRYQSDPMDADNDLNVSARICVMMARQPDSRLFGVVDLAAAANDVMTAEVR